MKAIIFFMCILFAQIAQAQQPTPPKASRDTTIHNVKYTIYIGSRGGQFINKVSKTGTAYKQYLKH